MVGADVPIWRGDQEETCNTDEEGPDLLDLPGEYGDEEYAEEVDERWRYIDHGITDPVISAMAISIRSINGIAG